DGSVWLFSSSEAVANLASQPHLSRLDWRRARAVATHPRIADTLRAAGWGVVVESRPALKDIKAVVRSIESHYP
ncbi:MAG TPA: uroporphyrinogen-III synthase, partial [Polaromonas sp.]